MDRKIIFKYLSFLIFCILVLNLVAIKFYWYFTIRWFDMPMHFLGGLWLSSAIIWFFRKLDLSLKSIFYTLAGVLLIGILWEVYEILINNNFAQNPFDLPDTLSDLFFYLI